MTPTRSGNYFNIYYFGAHIHYLLIQWPEIEGMFVSILPVLCCSFERNKAKIEIM